MSGFNFRNLGKFESDAHVNDWARHNQVDPNSIKTRRNADGSLDADIREDAYDSSHSEIFGGYSRESGYQ